MLIQEYETIINSCNDSSECAVSLLLMLLMLLVSDYFWFRAVDPNVAVVMPVGGYKINIRSGAMINMIGKKKNKFLQHKLVLFPHFNLFFSPCELLDNYPSTGL